MSKIAVQLAGYAVAITVAILVTVLLSLKVVIPTEAMTFFASLGTFAIGGSTGIIVSPNIKTLHDGESEDTPK